MNFLPLAMIVKFPFPVQFFYFALSFVIAVAGTNRKMGFWGYLFFSIIFSPLIGLMVLLVSGKKEA